MYREDEFAEKLEEMVRNNINKQEDLEDQGQLIEKLMQETRAKKNKNKKKHFLSEICILLITSSIGVVNAFILITTQNFSVLGVTSIILPAILTMITGLQNTKKYEETWLRHQKTYSGYQMEAIKYIYQLGDYKSCNQTEITKEYLSKMRNVGNDNTKQFEKNMQDKTRNK